LQAQRGNIGLRRVKESQSTFLKCSKEIYRPLQAQRAVNFFFPAAQKVLLFFCEM
jgi:hypothetical protein